MNKRKYIRIIDKSVIVEAVQFNGSNGWEIERWTKGTVFESPILNPSIRNLIGEYLQIKTIEGYNTAIVGDLVVRGEDGKFYLCNCEMFFKIFERL